VNWRRPALRRLCWQLPLTWWLHGLERLQTLELWEQSFRCAWRDFAGEPYEGRRPPRSLYLIVTDLEFQRMMLSLCVR
jgi:hypothetical protein